MAETMMGNVIEYLAKALVDSPEDVRITETDDGERIVVRLDVNEEDWGKVIGKGGRIASSMRSMLKVAAVREDVRAQLEIGD
ncbi:MAG: KH domain-containing protein [Dehalococcoidia bacterium]|nr:KH domain-containing protein [Dehalococcoidia bacterium]